MFHKVQKALMLETDVSETVNECIKAVRKRGRIGLIAAYSSYTNAFNIGSLMEKCVLVASPSKWVSSRGLTTFAPCFPLTAGASAFRATARLRSTSTGKRSSTTTSVRARCGCSGLFAAWHSLTTYPSPFATVLDRIHGYAPRTGRGLCGPLRQV